MNTLNPQVALLLSLLALLGVGCPAPATVLPDNEPPIVPPSVLGADDVVEIRVFQEDDLSGEFRIDSDGSINFPLVGRVRMAGLLPSAASELLQAGLADDFLVNPQVSVTVLEFNSRKVSVIGEVQSPGRYVYRDGMTVIQAIAEAGGTTEVARLDVVQVSRTFEGGKRYDVPFKAITLGRSSDFPLIPGDVVLVQESAVR